jgi:hypothetical protein
VRYDRKRRTAHRFSIQPSQNSLRHRSPAGALTSLQRILGLRHCTCNGGSTTATPTTTFFAGVSSDESLDEQVRVRTLCSRVDRLRRFRDRPSLSCFIRCSGSTSSGNGFASPLPLNPHTRRSVDALRRVNNTAHSSRAALAFKLAQSGRGTKSSSLVLAANSRPITSSSSLSSMRYPSSIVRDSSTRRPTGDKAGELE